MHTEMDFLAGLIQRDAMAWRNEPGEEHPVVHPAKKAGFTGYVGSSWDEEGQENAQRDHDDPKLHIFVSSHGWNKELWRQYGELGRIDLTEPVYATQSHVSQTHVDKYRANPYAGVHQPSDSGPYLGDEHPLFVTHEGRLHVTDGHHRVAAALQRGDQSIHGWHYNLDKHPLTVDGDTGEWHDEHGRSWGE